MAGCRTAPFLVFPSIQQGSVSSLPLSGCLGQGLSLTKRLHDTSCSGIARLLGGRQFTHILGGGNSIESESEELYWCLLLSKAEVSRGSVNVIVENGSKASSLFK